MKAYEEFIREMSRSELKQLENRLTVLLAHLLKLKQIKGETLFQNSRAWLLTVTEQRSGLQQLINSYPHLKASLKDELLDVVYKVAVNDVRKEYPTVNWNLGWRRCPICPFIGFADGTELDG